MLKCFWDVTITRGTDTVTDVTEATTVMTKFNKETTQVQGTDESMGRYSVGVNLELAGRLIMGEDGTETIIKQGDYYIVFQAEKMDPSVLRNIR